MAHQQAGAAAGRHADADAVLGKVEADAKGKLARAKLRTVCG